MSSSSDSSSDSETEINIKDIGNGSGSSSSSDSDESSKPAFYKIIKDKEQAKPERKSRFSFLVPQNGSEESEEDHDKKQQYEEDLSQSFKDQS